MNFDERIDDMGQTRKDLAKEFNECRPILFSIRGHNTAKHYFMFIRKYSMRRYASRRLSSVIHISRTALSYHLKILKESGIVAMREEGTKEFLLLELSESTYGFFSQIIS